MTTITTPENLIKPHVALVGEDGNAFSIMGRVTKALKAAGNDESVIDSYMLQAMNGSYEHVLRVTLAFIIEGHDENHEFDLADCCFECGEDLIAGECEWCD